MPFFAAFLALLSKYLCLLFLGFAAYIIIFSIAAKSNKTAVTTYTILLELVVKGVEARPKSIEAIINTKIPIIRWFLNNFPSEISRVMEGVPASEIIKNTR